MADLAALGSARVIGKMVVSAGRFGTYKEALKALLTQFHEKNPLKVGISREELRTRLPDVDPVIFQAALEDAVKAGDAEIEKDRVRLSGGTGTPDESIGKLEGQVAAMLEARGLTPPTTQEMADELRIKERSLRDILEKLVYAGKVVKVKSDMYLAARHIEELKGLVKEQLTRRKEMLPADFKEMTGLSRKYMIPLLEYLDEIKLTIRSGDKRVLRSG